MIDTKTKPHPAHLLGLAKLLAITCFFSMPHIAIASNACPLLPCSSAAECRAIASWAIEGTVVDAIGDKPGEACMRGPMSCKKNPSGEMICEDEKYCGSTAPQPILVLEKVSVLKGSYSVLSRQMRALVQRDSLCYSPQISNPLTDLPRVDLTSIERVPPNGERVRVYGRKGDRVGYYYFIESADPELPGCATKNPTSQCTPAK